jgi:uncharacterized protein
MSKPQFLYIVRLARPALLTEGPDAEEQRVLGAHFAYVERLTDEGTMILVGRTQTTGPETFGLAIFEADSEEEARRIMEEDPAVAQGLMRAELYPYKVALMRRARSESPSR